MANKSNISNTPNQIPKALETQENKNLVEGQETIKLKVIRLLLAFQMAVGGSGVAYAGELPKDLSVKNPDTKELVVDANVRTEIINEFITNFKKGPNNFIQAFEKLSINDQNKVTNYYIIGKKEGDDQKWLLKGTLGFAEALDNMIKSEEFLTIYKETGKVGEMPPTIIGKINIALKGFTGAKEFLVEYIKIGEEKDSKVKKIVDNTIAQNEHTIAQNEHTIAQNEHTIAQNEQIITLGNKLIENTENIGKLSKGIIKASK